MCLNSFIFNNIKNLTRHCNQANFPNTQKFLRNNVLMGIYGLEKFDNVLMLKNNINTLNSKHTEHNVVKTLHKGV